MSQEEGQAIEQPSNYEASIQVARGLLDAEDTPPPEVIDKVEQPIDKPPVKEEPVLEEETQPEETADESPKEEKAEEQPEEIQLDPDAPLFEIEETREGGLKEKVKLSLNELKKQRMMQADYTRKTQELAAQRKAIPEEAKKLAEPQLKAAEQALLTAQQLVMESLTPELASMTPQKWAELSQQDPAQYVALKARQEQFASQIQAVSARQRQLNELKEQQRAGELTKSAQASIEILQKEIPNWSTETYEAILNTGSEYGFEPAELGRVNSITDLKPVYFTDARIVKAFHELATLKKQLSGLQDTKKVLEKKVVAVPKVIKPGTAEKPDPKRESYEKAMSKLKKSGATSDAEALAKFLV